MNELKRHKKSDKIKWVITGIAFVLVFVLFAGLCMQLFGQGKVKPSEWFKKTETEQSISGNSNNKNEVAEGMVIPSETNGKQVRVTSRALSASAYSDYGVSAQAENAYTLTAEVFPDYASDKSLDWSVSWLNKDSTFASGKTVTDYVTITPTKDGALTAVCTCLQDFGETILLTVSSRSNPEVFGTCYVQYYQRVKSCDYIFRYNGEEISVNNSDGVYKVDYTGALEDYTVELKPVYSNYTLTDTYSTTINGSLSSTFGYTAAESLNTIKIPAGLSGGDPELTENALNWCNYVGQTLFSYPNMGNSYIGYINMGKGLCLGNTISAYGQTIKPEYKLTDEEKLHPRCAYYISLITDNSNFADEAAYTQAKAKYNNYQPSSYNYFGAQVSNYNDFVSAVKRCNSGNVGVVQYTISINGEYSSYESVLNLSYNDEFKINAQDLNLSDIEIAF